MARSLRDAGKEGPCPAEEVYVDYLERLEAGEELSFEAVRARHPELDESLRELHRLSSEVDRFLARDDAARRRHAPGALDAERSPVVSDRFEVHERIGEGGMGVVYRVTDREIGRELAMKVLRRTRDRPSTFDRRVVRFLQEAAITGRLGHPGVVPIHERGCDAEGCAFYTMPLVVGHDFERVLGFERRGERGWTLNRALEVVLKVCDTMAFAHDKGVIHRDLKPTNVRVGEFGEVYVMDWGLARVYRQAEEPEPPRAGPATTIESGNEDEPRGELPLGLTHDGEVLGTPAYMSPEQAAGALELGPATDVYAIGAMLYQLLARHAPYVKSESETHAEILERVLAGPPQRIPAGPHHAPPELVAVTERAMARDPRGRYGDVGELAAELRAYLEGRVVGTYEHGPWAELRKWTGRNSALAGSLLALFVVLVVGLAGIAWMHVAKARDELLSGDVYRLQAYIEEADELWPARAAMIPRYEEWLARACELAARREEHRRRASSIDPVAALSDSASAAEDERRRMFQRGLDDFVDPDPARGTIADVERRLELARSLERRTIVEWRDAWDAAREHFRSQYPVPAGVELRPIAGLIPLGADPRTGLLEFAHLASGEPAARAVDGTLRMRAENGLVLVLLPGGEFRMGAEAGGAAGTSDPNVSYTEAPVHTVHLAPFLLSKFEMTQAQWRRATWESPSAYVRPDTVGETLPVESVSWFDCRTALARLDLVLPTEAQWEYAARGGSSAPWWWGDDARSIRERLRVDAPGPAPVGSLPANPFGLHDMLGNVSEWCRDAFGSYGAPWPGRVPGEERDLTPWPLDPSSGERAVVGTIERVLRGANHGVSDGPAGEFTWVAVASRASFRMEMHPAVTRDIFGLRPARSLTP